MGLVAVLAFAGGVLAAVTTVNLSNATLTGLPTAGDADKDRVPDAIEKELCGRQFTREQIALAEVGRCKSLVDYLPPEERHLMPLYLVVASGVDADKDLVPSKVTLTSTIVIIDPFQTKEAIVRMTPGTDSTDVQLDTDDADPNQPAVSKVVSPIEVPLDMELGKDVDRDALPGSMTLKWAKLSLDRTNVKSPISLVAASTQAIPIDENDKDANVPASSQVDISIPTKASHSGDGDNDLLPGSVTVKMETYKFDRRMNVLKLSYVGATSSTREIDGDDKDRDSDLPMSAVDMDADFMPDSIEGLVCKVQSESDPSDGRCVKADGSGVDGSGSNFMPPVGVPNPWSFAPPK